MKKYLAIAMAALLLVCSLASCAGGQSGDIGDYTPEVDYLITDKGTFYFDEGEGETAILVNYVGKATAGDHVEIPATFGDRTVTVIGKQAFYNLAAIVEITIPDTVVKIEDYAFARCTELTEVNLPAGTLEIGEGAFLQCTKLAKVDLGDSLEVIGEKAFNGCTALTDVTLPASMTTIGKAAFAFCGALTSLSVPASVTSVGELAFTDCMKLETITFANADTEIGTHAFENSDGTNFKDKFVTEGMAEDSKVFQYVAALTDDPVIPETETETEAE